MSDVAAKPPPQRVDATLAESDPAFLSLAPRDIRNEKGKLKCTGISGKNKIEVVGNKVQTCGLLYNRVRQQNLRSTGPRS